MVAGQLRSLRSLTGRGAGWTPTRDSYWYG
uniref:Uncharacterized protein n=1 Tax=CrAss-like virus sp. ctt4r3 TaxID=2823619 RepID=A0A8S5L7A4_9CAUD|nr:MAG TPA: hypothetical protein [CrAss-like virus sp. ctt4r3]